VESIQQARKSVLVEAYSLTSRTIARALIDAKQRGVDVELILDKSQCDAVGSDVGMLARSGIATFTNQGEIIPPSAHTARSAEDGVPHFSGTAPRYGLAHSKVMIIDGATVITGSFNFTRSAEEYNVENLLVISNDPPLADAYTLMWKRYLAQSKPYSSRSRHDPVPGFWN
jgi:phosphatidylserine/phosphatidylglycerophosphate/cardiolipin synthase-like enzyme